MEGDNHLFAEDGVMAREERELKLDKIELLEKEIGSLKVEIELMKKRIKKCWGAVEKKCQ